MAVAVMERFHFPEDPGPGVTRHFLDYLNSKLHFSVDVDARLHRCISSFSEYFTGELVQFLEARRHDRTGRTLLLLASFAGFILTSLQIFSSLLSRRRHSGCRDLCASAAIPAACLRTLTLPFAAGITVETPFVT